MAAGKKTGGRQKGTPNKLTASVKDSILAAFDEVGGPAYLVKQAEDHPVAFLSLLGRVLPIQAELSGANGGPFMAAVATVNAREFQEIAQSVVAEV